MEKRVSMLRKRVILGLCQVSLVVLLVLTVGMTTARAGTLAFGETGVWIKVNATAEEAGIQVLFDAAEWKKVKVFSPRAGKILDVMNFAGIRRLGGSELFMGSEAVPFTAYPLEKFLMVFPEGKYTFRGITVNGDKLIDSAMLTHIIPAGPEIISPDVDALLNPFDPIVIMWNPVDMTITGSDQIEIVAYRVMVERLDPLPAQVFTAELPASATSVTVPEEFIQAGAEYRVEVIAEELSGNQTLEERGFTTEE